MKKHARALGIFGAALGIGGPIAARFASDAGYVATIQTVLYATIFMGAVCVIGAVVSYRLAKDQLKRHLQGDFD